MQTRCELDVTGYGVVNFVTNGPGSDNCEQGVAVRTGVEVTNLNHAAISARLANSKAAAEKNIMHPGLQELDARQNQVDARQFRAAAKWV